MSIGKHEHSIYIGDGIGFDEAKQAVNAAIRPESEYCHDIFDTCNYVPGFSYEVEMYGWPRLSVQNYVNRLKTILGVPVIGDWELDNVVSDDEWMDYMLKQRELISA